MDLLNRRILVTGSTGMVGSNLVRALKLTQCEVHHPSRDSLNLLNREAVFNYFTSNAIDTVIHAAGLVGGIAANIERPYSFLSTNTTIGINLVEAAVSHNVSRFINLGSSCMYPKDQDGVLKENMILTGPLEPTNEGYALAKIVISRMCEYAKDEFGLDYKTIIPCNLYGEFDNFDPLKSHMIPAVIRKIHEAKQSNTKVSIWGSGEARREFMYVGDLVDFLIFALHAYEELPTTLNVGIGRDYSINEYYEIISDVIGYDGGFNHDLSKPEGMKRKLVSTSKLKQLGWSSKTSLREGITKTYEYYKQNYGI